MWPNVIYFLSIVKKKSGQSHNVFVQILYICSTKATEKTDLDLYPVQRYGNGSAVEVDGTVFCENSTGAPTSAGLSMSTANMVGR